MAFCAKCGRANDPGAAFCGACGASLAASGGVANLAAPPAAAAKKKTGVVMKVVIGMVMVFIVLPAVVFVIAGFVTGTKPAKPFSPPPATEQQLADAQRLGLSKDFATQAWQTQRNLQFQYTGLATANTLKDYDASLDDSLRSSLPGLKQYIHTDADKQAFQKMVALSWVTHAAAGKFDSHARDPLFRRLIAVGEGCGYAVGMSFEVWDKYLKAKAVKTAASCLSEQRKAKEDLDRQGIPNWDDIKE